MLKGRSRLALDMMHKHQKISSAKWRALWGQNEARGGGDCGPDETSAEAMCWKELQSIRSRVGHEGECD